MRYSIGYLLTGEAKRFYEKKRKELAKKFNEPYLINNPIPSHSTLKYSFDAAKIQIKKIEEFEKIFSKIIERFDYITVLSEEETTYMPEMISGSAKREGLKTSLI